MPSGRSLWIDGKTLIHPNQIATCNNAFTPSDDVLKWAHAVIYAFDLPENQEKGALKVDGKMVERLHLDQARRVLAIHEGRKKARTP